MTGNYSQRGCSVSLPGLAFRGAWGCLFLAAGTTPASFSTIGRVSLSDLNQTVLLTVNIYELAVARVLSLLKEFLLGEALIV